MKSNLKAEFDEKRFERKVEKFINSSLAVILSGVFVLVSALAWFYIYTNGVESIVK